MSIREFPSMRDAAIPFWGMAMMMVYGHLIQHGVPSEQLPNPNKEAKIVNIDTNEIILEQEGKEFTIKTQDVPKDLMEKLIAEKPELKSFLENGPIHIINTNK